ncbi:MAG: hypothetical protein AB8B69_06990 [Chitinophagales bacterium]
MKNLCVYFTLLFTNVICSIAQDTLLVEPSIFYSSVEYPYRSKTFAVSAEYAREDIVFNPLHKRVEYCYYYDNQRICFGDTYYLINDSTLQIGDLSDVNHEIWYYKQVAPKNYKVTRYYNGLQELGQVNSLMPFLKRGQFITKSILQNDTLWGIDYSDYNIKRPLWRYPKYFFPKSKVNGKIYQDYDVDRFPRTKEECVLDTIRLARKDVCYGESLLAINNVTFIVTKIGEVKNIEQFEGGFKFESCPFYLYNLMKEIMKHAPFEPAMINNKKVNVRWYVEIDMIEESLRRYAKHPGFRREREFD